MVQLHKRFRSCSLSRFIAYFLRHTYENIFIYRHYIWFIVFGKILGIWCRVGVTRNEFLVDLIGAFLKTRVLNTAVTILFLDSAKPISMEFLHKGSLLNHVVFAKNSWKPNQPRERLDFCRFDGEKKSFYFRVEADSSKSTKSYLDGYILSVWKTQHSNWIRLRGRWVYESPWDFKKWKECIFLMHEKIECEKKCHFNELSNKMRGNAM